MHIEGQMALVHASPATTWRAPTAEASDVELEAVYAPLGQAAGRLRAYPSRLYPQNGGHDCGEHSVA